MDEQETKMDLELTVNLGGIVMANPVAVASGTFGYGREYEDYLDIAGLGAVIVKGTTLEPRPGNPPPRILETAAGMLNAIGLENPGVEVFINEYLPYLVQKKVTVIANIAGNTVEEYAAIAARSFCGTETLQCAVDKPVVCFFFWIVTRLYLNHSICRLPFGYILWLFS